MSAHDIRLLLSDVDGTLVTHGKILTPRAIAAVQALRAKGVAFAVTSGRPPRGMQMLFAPLDIKTPVAGFNGGIYANTDLTTIAQHTLPADVARGIAESIVASGLDLWVYAGEDWLVRDAKGAHVEREAWTVKYAPKVVAEFPPAFEGVVKVVGVTDDAALMEKAQASAVAAFGSKASIACSQTYYLDATHPAANKGDVVLYLSRMMGIPTDQIATIGDMPNDTLMFAKSGLSIAMGQASDAVKAKASEVTASSEDEGFAKAVERLILG